MTVHTEECCSSVINSTISFDANKQELHETNCELVTKKSRTRILSLITFHVLPFCMYASLAKAKEDRKKKRKRIISRNKSNARRKK